MWMASSLAVRHRLTEPVVKSRSSVLSTWLPLVVVPTLDPNLDKQDRTFESIACRCLGNMAVNLAPITKAALIRAKSGVRSGRCFSVSSMPHLSNALPLVFGADAYQWGIRRG